MDTMLASQKLFTLFNLYNSRDFVLVEPGGNFGDFIIYMGAYKLAALAGLSYKRVCFAEFMETHYPPDTVIYIHGGGGINSFWSGRSIKALKKALSSHRGVVIVGPSTLQTDELFLNRLIDDMFSRVEAEDVFLFCRENLSFERLREKIPAEINIFVDHDTALNLKKEDMPVTDFKRTDILYCIRSDKEMNPAQEYNFLSKWVDPITCSRNFEEWLALHAGAQRIITNRLHSAILGVVLEIPVTLLPNNYHKNRAVWEFSLKEKDVKWADEIYVGHFNMYLSRISTLRKIRYSKLCQRMIRHVFI